MIDPNVTIGRLTCSPQQETASQCTTSAARASVLVHMSTLRKRVLIVAQGIEVRGRIARVVQSAGHVVELAGCRTRALELAASKKIDTAIVVSSEEFIGLRQELCEHVHRM